MSVAVTVLNQRRVPGVGLITTGTFGLSSTYTTGGDDSNLAAKLQPVGPGPTPVIDSVMCGFSGDYTAFFNPANAKLRIFKIASGVMTERSNGSSYDASVAIPFTCISR